MKKVNGADENWNVEEDVSDDEIDGMIENELADDDGKPDESDDDEAHFTSNSTDETTIVIARVSPDQWGRIYDPVSKTKKSSREDGWR